MSEIVIKAEGLGKKYVIGHQAENGRYVALRDVVMHNARRMWQTTKDLMRGDAVVEGDSLEEVWALRDINFEIHQGDVVGIIGRNGSGKSSLLKILSRITEPTEGRVQVRGRVASLLEVGTGFHPELTGRENIFLNGAILGMSRAEIRLKFDEIVTFAEIEKFLDTPVKRYSSGMYVRLAFAVAAHLEPEILLVDEVLAVGDVAFQQKCIGKMNQVAGEGRTILFVSHNMMAVRNLCNRAVLLSSGKITSNESSPSRAIAAYMGQLELQQTEWSRPEKALQYVRSPIIFTRLSTRLLGKQPYHKLLLELELRSLKRHSGAFLAFDVLDSYGTTIFQALPTQEPIVGFSNEPSVAIVEIDLPPLVPGSYQVNAWIGPHYMETWDQMTSGPRFVVETSPTPNRTVPHSPDHGSFVPTSRVSLRKPLSGDQLIIHHRTAYPHAQR